MRASVETLLSLFEWGQIMGLSPWELAQFTSPTDNDARCETVFFQYQWQRDFLSREEVAGAIEKAEAAIADQLGWWPAPKYLTTTQVVVPGRGWAANQRRTLSLPYRYVQGGGVLARTLLSAGTAVTRTDTDGDTVKDLFTANLTVPSGTLAAEIGLYIKAADRQNAPIDETWRVRPVTVVVSGTAATITGHAALLALPIKTSVVNPTELDVAENGNYVAEVEVYRVYRDTTATDATPSQGYAMWDGSLSNPCTAPPCTQTQHALCVAEASGPTRQVVVGYGDPGTCYGWRNPSRVQVNYLAGYPLANGRMDRSMADLVAHLATAWLPVEKCGCERSNRIIHYWRGLPNEESGEGEGGRPVTFDEINSPFGERRGAVYAWSRVKALRKTTAIQL